MNKYICVSKELRTNIYLEKSTSKETLTLFWHQVTRKTKRNQKQLHVH